ncbi:PAS and ANTAR domain-containing protein [Mycolicibacterium komossense]|uniref:ANTAR domain-containing protein n=1 Tax=Mycolicibacterium komossense TaxID=1779 RepID=A0ABT3C6D2_9MYCO|nr:PAS and ANTAR domain-containing protein [Mycolicibacterium komossense]MCV7225019.1 ANTAR domain-containing protein [Mycolicibacterium komossense]
MAKPPPDDETPLPDAVEGPPLEAGWFRFFFDSERWEWSPEAARIHGYETGPATMTPSTALVMSHKHPDDRARMDAHLHHVRQARTPINTRHRIIDAQGQTRDVVVVAELIGDEHGIAMGTAGFYIDVSPAPSQQATDDAARHRQRDITEAVEAVVERRSRIDQLKGMLMLIYGVDADRAFGLLKWRSQDTNVKVHILAQQLTSDFLALIDDEHLPPRSKFDSAFLTAHLRVQAA